MQKISEKESPSEIKKDLPSLSTIVTRLLNVILDDKVSIRDISKVIRVDQALVSKVLDAANAAFYKRGLELGLTVVAEGVENREIYDRLSELGCNVGQGSFICPPLPEAELRPWIDELSIR